MRGEEGKGREGTEKGKEGMGRKGRENTSFPEINVCFYGRGRFWPDNVTSC